MSKSTFRQFAVALAMGAAALGANATVYNLGLLDTTKAQSNIQFTDGFADTFSFIASGHPAAFSGVVGLLEQGDLSLSYRLGQGAEGSVTWGGLTTVAVPTDINTGDFAWSTVLDTSTSGQTYWIDISGGVGSGGYYSATLVPVPEPETFALMLLGLGALGVFSRRKAAASKVVGA